MATTGAPRPSTCPDPVVQLLRGLPGSNMTTKAAALAAAVVVVVVAAMAVAVVVAATAAVAMDPVVAAVVAMEVVAAAMAVVVATGETTSSSSCAGMTVIWMCLLFCTEEEVAVAMEATEDPMQHDLMYPAQLRISKRPFCLSQNTQPAATSLPALEQTLTEFVSLG